MTRLFEQTICILAILFVAPLKPRLYRLKANADSCSWNRRDYGGGNRSWFS